MKACFFSLLLASTALGAQTSKVSLSYQSEQFDPYITLTSAGHIIEARMQFGHTEFPLDGFDGSYLARVLTDAYPDEYIFTTDGQSLITADSTYAQPIGFTATALALDLQSLGNYNYRVATYFVGSVPEPAAICLLVFVPFLWRRVR